MRGIGPSLPPHRRSSVASSPSRNAIGSWTMIHRPRTRWPVANRPSRRRHDRGAGAESRAPWSRARRRTAPRSAARPAAPQAHAHAEPYEVCDVACVGVDRGAGLGRAGERFASSARSARASDVPRRLRNQIHVRVYHVTDHHLLAGTV